MSLLYADTSALARAYFVDEPDHVTLRAKLLEGTEPVITSELARVELASAVGAAARGGGVTAVEGLLARIDADCRADGPISLLRLHPDVILPTAHRLVIEHGLRTLDALHVAVALEEGRALVPDGDLVFLTRDVVQAEAAAALGLVVG